MICLSSCFTTYNNPQQSLPLVAGTAKTLRLFVRPCAGRYARNKTTQPLTKEAG